MWPKHLSQRLFRPRGSVTVEFALILPILLYLVLGIIEFGWMVRCHLIVANAVREGTRYAALGNPSTAVKTRVKNAAAALMPGLTDAQIVLDQTADKVSSSPVYSSWPADANSKNGVVVGNLLRVSANYPFRPLTGFFPFLRNRTVAVSATMTRENS